jgi:deoxycytidylate deaminase
MCVRSASASKLDFLTISEERCRVCDIVRSKSDCFKRKVGAVFVNADKYKSIYIIRKKI